MPLKKEKLKLVLPSKKRKGVLYARGMHESNLKFLATESARLGMTIAEYLNNLLDQIREYRDAS